MIDFEDIMPNTCGEFCTSHGLQCDDANDDKKNKCKVKSNTASQYTCDTEILGRTGWDAICYCADPPRPTGV